MISALAFLQYHSFVNRLTTRIRRLKQPKYLLGAVVGGLYFYFYFFRYLFHGSGRRPFWNAAGVSPEHALAIQSLAALALFVVAVFAWLIPHERAALTFSEAEVAFLFPAPISRAGLVHFKLVRSQIRILFSVFLLVLITNRGGIAWIHAAGLWIVLSTVNLHFLGSSFARTMLLDHGISNWIRRAVVAGVVIGLAGAVLVWARNTLPPLTSSDLSNLDAILDYTNRLLTSGPALYLLYPFRLLARPYFAPDAPSFLAALGPALLIVALHYVWVVYSNVAFEEASVEASQRMAARIAAVRAGNLQGGRRNQKGKRALFKLAPTGPPAIAFLWKNLISAGQSFTWRLWIMLTVLAVVLYTGVGSSLHAKELFSGLSLIIGIILGWSLLLGPQLFRQDLRQDLPMADVLKTYPLRGWQVVLGEVLAPAVILGSAQCLLVVFGTAFLLHARGLSDGTLPFAIAFAALILLPVLDALLLLIPNAAVLLFPSWISTGRESPRGIEATGQRLILMLGQLLVFAVALLPVAIVFLLVLFLVKILLGLALAVACASLAAAVSLTVETGLGVILLGRLFERFDLSAELSP